MTGAAGRPMGYDGLPFGANREAARSMPSNVPTLAPLHTGLWAAWSRARGAVPLPTIPDVVAGMVGDGLPVGALSILRVSHPPPRIRVTFSGDQLDAALGFRFAGADLLELTPAPERPLRYARFAAVQARPCGMLTRDLSFDRSLDAGTYVEALSLPALDGDDGGPRILSLLSGLDAFGGKRGPLMFPDRIEWLDLGAGIPTPADLDGWFLDFL